MTEPLSAELAANLIGFCENRSRVYTLLSRCFEKELDAAFAQQLAACDAYSFDDPALDAAFSALRSDVADLDERALEQLAVVFDRVFFGMGPRTAQKAFPYESVYTSEGGLMMQDAYADVLHVYRAARFEKNPGFTEPEDHLAVELAFMARLGERAVDELRANDADAAEASLAAQRVFLRDHLLNWTDRFAADMESAAGEGFYAHLASFTRAFLVADADELAEVLE